MKKKLTKLLAVILSLCFCTSIVACTPSAPENAADTIYVYNYNGGFGTEWLNRAKTAYEKLNPEITIKVNPQKPLGPLSASDVKAGKDELWFSDSISLYNFYAEGVIDSVNQALTTPNPYDNGKIIADKLTEEQKSFYKINGGDYYALPHYTGYMGFFYNVDTFYDYGFFFKENKPAEPFASNPDGYFTKYKDEFSKGPDGTAGTYDDGLPATYEEFFYLLQYMSINGFTYDKDKSPIIHTGGNNAQYVGETIYSLVADYEGYEQMMMNFTFEGEAKSLGKIVNGKFVKDETPTVITNANGYELARQEGKYYALEFLDKMYSNENYYDKTVAAMTSFRTNNAATRLIRGNAGILLEGVWWEEESKPIFQQLGKTKYDYNLAVMPFPKANEEKVGEKVTIYDHLQSTCFMKKGIDEEKKAKIYDFIQFLYADEQLIDFTATTGTLKGVKYEVPESALKNLTLYEKTLVDYCSKADIIYPGNDNPLYYNNYTSFRSYYYLSSQVAGDKKYDNPVPYFLNKRVNSGGSFKPSLTDYFNGIYDYYSSTWSTNYSKYFN